MIVNRYTLVIDVPNYVPSAELVSEILSTLQYNYLEGGAVQLIDSQPHIEVGDDE